MGDRELVASRSIGLPWWGRFHAAHLHDYGVAASRLWLALACLGAYALALSIVRLQQFDVGELCQVLGWGLIAAFAAAFPIQVPRSKHSIATGDVVIFLLLAIHGTPAAVLAASAEAFVASSRTSARLSSRIASTSAAAIGMAIGGCLLDVSESLLGRSGMPHAPAHMAGLAVAVLIYFVISTTVLMQILCLKRGMRLTPTAWFNGTSWVGALYLVSAVLAGLLSLNAQQFGRGAAVVGVLVIGVALAFLRAHLRHRIAEDEAQEARVAAAQSDAEQSQRRFHSAFTRASIGMAIVSRGTVIQVNRAFCALLGYDEQSLTGGSFRDLLQPGDAALLDRHVARVADGNDDTFSIELRCICADLRETWVSLHCARFDEQAARGGLIFQLHDITSRRRAEGELRHIAYHDSLTDLANRNCFQERLTVAVERSRSDPSFSFAVMYLDLDRFKLVNDGLGHPAGDELLKEAARRLVASVRPKDLVARLGGDEFAILLEDTEDPREVIALGERLVESLKDPIVICGTEVRPLASVGVTFSDLGYREADEVLRDADLAMYKAKADGKGRMALFDASLHAQLGQKLLLEADLRHAIENGQLTLAFQPLFDLESRRLSGFEALTRWVHPTRGAVSPSIFIALAEEIGCIEALTTWAIDEAARQLAEWRCESSELSDIVMHVNISGKDLARQQLVPHVRRVLERHRVPAHLLTLELTESTLMEQRELAMRSLAELRALGVKLSIDDFGTGYSSLAYLSTLPFDCLKIDRSFVVGMNKAPQNVEIIRTIISLAESLNKKIIAEGIETPEQLMLLQELGVPVGQGYLLGRPLAPSDVRRLLAEPQRASALAALGV